MNGEQPPEKVLDLVRKLLALSTSSNENEAAVAASKAQALLLKYNLEASQIGTGRDEASEVERQNYSFEYQQSWLDSLLHGIAKTNLCRVVKSSEYRTGQQVGNRWVPGKNYRLFYMFGKRPNMEVVEYMFSYLAEEIERLTPKGQGARYNQSFRLGAVATVYNRLQAELQAFQVTPETTALVVTNDQALEKRINEDFPRLTHSKAHAKDTWAYNEGRAAGNSIQFRKGVAANAAGQALLK